jgi:hypothetical protein
VRFSGELPVVEEAWADSPEGVKAGGVLWLPDIKAEVKKAGKEETAGSVPPSGCLHQHFHLSHPAFLQ